VEGNLDLQEIPKPVPILKKRAPRKKVVMVKDENEKGEIFFKNWVDGEVPNLIALKG